MLKNLQGKHVLVTRTAQQAGALCELLQAAEAVPIALPMIEITDPLDWQPVDKALTLVHEYDWLIFTSVNVVEQVFKRLGTLGYGLDGLKKVQIATVGPQTALALEEAGVRVELVPKKYALTHVVDAFRDLAGEAGLAGKKFLLLRPVGGRREVVEELLHDGAIVDEVATHQALPLSPDTPESRAVVEMMKNGELDAITFTGSSTVQHFVSWMRQAAPEILQSFSDTGAKVQHPLLAAIGPVTGSTLGEYGLPLGVVATEYTIEGLVEALKLNLN
jgi:uroporphyrinogen III methyltransferase/synthase